MIVEGIGELRERGEFWVLTYASCGHEQWFPRGLMNYAEHAVTREVVRYCGECQAWEHRPSRPGE